MLVLNGAGLAHAHVPQADTARVATGYRVGDQVSDAGITLKVPARGQFAWGELKYKDGTSQILQLETDATGRVFSKFRGREGTPREEEAKAIAAKQATGRHSTTADADEGAISRTSSECSSTSYYSYGWKIWSYGWYVQTGSIPSYLRNRSNGVANVLTQLKYAASNITGADNSCGRADYIGATNTYRGATSRSNNISTDARCTGGDGYSVVNFGYLPSGVLGMACAYGWSGGTAREGDVRLNLRTKWETHSGWCSSETLIQSAATHEFGHIFGLGHVYGSPQTMNPYVPNCSLSPTTLGRGDLAGFERKY